VDSDGHLFINYLMGCGLQIKEEKTVIDKTVQLKDLDRHKNYIEGSLTTFAKDPSIHEKYIWLANYHNQFIRDSELIEKQAEGLLINSKLLVCER